MKNKKSISQPLKGMQRDNHISQLKPDSYTLGVNINTSNENEGFIVQNEPSNYYNVQFPNTYKVIGLRKDLLQERTYYLLTSVETDEENENFKRSSIGFVDDIILETFNQDSPVEGCDDCSKSKNSLGTPLEDTIQTPLKEYQELIHDRCIAVEDLETKGLNFNINFPIKKIEIKQEKLGTNLYWNDNRNGKRYLNVSDTSYLFTQVVPCEDDITVDCPLFEKLLVFPKHNKIQIQAETLQVGGNLKLGTYEFYVVYCDSFGNEMTGYSTPTNPISIFDENNNILSPTETDVFTNFAIKLKIDNLDATKFKYYKIVCVERNNVGNAQSAFIEGIHPTTDNTVVYTHSGSSSDDFITRGNISIKKRIDFNKLNLIKPHYDKAESTMVSGGRLWSKSLTQREEINLQPVVNLFSGLLEWQTTASKADLYKSAIATSKYKGYSRDEVQPFGLRFFYKDGDYSAVFPMVGRPALEEDITEVSDINFESIDANTPNCAVNERNKKWQIFNTAEIKETCSEIDTGTEITEPIRKTCIVENVFTIPAGTTTIELTEEYTNLIDYIEDNPDVVIPGITEYLEDEYSESHCTPDFEDTCEDIELESFENSINTVINETVTLTEAVFPDEYQPLKAPEYCNIYKQDYSSGSTDLITDEKFRYEFMYAFGSPPLRIFYNVKERAYSFTNETCTFAEEIININLPSDDVGSYFHNYRGETLLADLQTTKETTPDLPYFTDKVHKGGLWYKAKVNARESFVLELSKLKDQGNKDDIISSSFNPDKNVRVSLFNKCSDTTAFYSIITPLKTTGLQLKIDVNYTTEEVIINGGSPISIPNVFSNGTFIVSVDDPIYPCEGIETWDDIDDEQSDAIISRYRTAPVDGCYSIVTRDLIYTEAVVSWDEIILDKTETYVATCTFILPDVDECEPKAYERGRFSYWESTEQYPDNNQLYNSSILKIKPADLITLSADKITDFEEYFTENGTVDINGDYILKSTTNLTCSPIRHPKFPDNIVAPFMYDNSSLRKFAETIIFPLGIVLDSKIISSMLNVALANNLITKKEFDNIEGYEVLRGDNSIHKSIIANGLGFDMYNYEKENEKWWYSNFPFNDLGKDKYHTTDELREELIEHPYNSEKNHLYSFLSPDLFLTKPAIPTEVSLSGYQFGNARESFVNVKDHPKYTILGSKARSLATTLAIAETVLETLVKAGEMTSRQWFTFGTSSGTSLGLVGTIIVTAAYAAQSFMKIGQYRYEWLQTFKNLGGLYNFASMNVGVGTYNRFLKNDTTSDNYLRGLSVKKYLKDGMFTITDEKDGSKLNINNWLREESVLFSVGENFQIEYPTEYIRYDNNTINSNSSKFVSSEIKCKSNVESIRDVASPYFTMKNYIPDQWGTVDSIKWLTTNYIFKLTEETECTPILGGTVCISPFSWRKKTPIFRSTAMGLADKLPYSYSEQENIGFPRFYIDYEVDTEYNGLLIPFPDIDSRYNLDCATGTRRFYAKPPSKIYLYSHGIVNFMVESEINCHFRYARKEPKDWFYPQVSNITDWVQEVNLPISEPNTFFYNNTYSFPVSNTPYKFLDYTYDKEVWRKRGIQPNAVIYSEQDNNENSLVDPWLVYKPLNWYEYKTSLGKLIDLKDIESQQFLARFENGLILNNAIDNLADRIIPQNKELGTAGIFAERPLEFKTTDLGFAGTQNTDICSTPYGHFWSDAKRGRVFQVDQNGKNLEVISESIQGKPSGMKNWFREHLPFKILKYLPEIDIDNKFKGLGLNIWYDDRQSRVFFTKRDYILQPGIDKNNFTFDKDTLQLFYNEEEVFFDNETLFKDVSWTIAFKPTEGAWSSYFTFFPDFSNSHQEYFQVGYNWGEDKETMWNHLLNSNSFGVFQGKYNEWILEFPVANENVNKILNSLSINIESKRYLNHWDEIIHQEIGVTDMFIYNATNNTGYLVLHPQKTLADSKNYPYVEDGKQHILTTFTEGKQNVNYLLNRVVDQNNNIPMFQKDENNIFKTIDSRAVKFGGKRVTEKMKGESFIVHLSNTQDSRFNILIKNIINNETMTD